MSFIPYNPCLECKHRGKTCNKCEFHNVELNYQRALKEIIKLSNELGKPITILV